MLGSASGSGLGLTGLWVRGYRGYSISVSVRVRVRVRANWSLG